MKKSACRYLDVRFYDNDFGGYVVDALQTLWRWIHASNAQCEISGRSLEDIFVLLNEHDALLPLLSKLIDAEYYTSDVEFATRGLYWKEVDWASKGKVTSAFQPLIGRLLSIKVYIRKSGRFTKRWQNGEAAYLNLQTGKSATF